MEGCSFSSSSSSSSSDLEAGFSGSALHPSSYSSSTASRNNNRRRRRGSYRAVAGSPRARFFCDPLSDDEPHHFLDTCFLCKKPLARNRDIFMYRGDTPFCSEECRQEQIEMDEAMEKNWKQSMKAASSRKEKQSQNQKSNATSPPKAQKIHVRAGTVVAG